MKNALIFKKILMAYPLLFLFAVTTLEANAVEEDKNKQQLNTTSESSKKATQKAGRADLGQPQESLDLDLLDLLAANTMSAMPDPGFNRFSIYPSNSEYTGNWNGDPTATAYAMDESTDATESEKETSEGEDDGWKFVVSPYLWGAMLRGTATAGTTEADIDLSFKDIWDSLNFGAMLDFQVEKGPWGLQTDVVYADLEDEDTIGPYELDFGTTMWIAELTGSYRLAECWKVLAGVRYYNLGMDLDVKGPVSLSGSDSEDWFDPIVGTAISLPITDNFSVTAVGDIGGFSVGSKLSWQLWGFLEYRLGEVPSVVLGYRHLDWDYETGSGASKFEMDTYMSGPFLGLRLYF